MPANAKRTAPARGTPCRRALRAAALLIWLVVAGCGSDEAPLFALVPSEESGVGFVNRIEEREGRNVLAYEYFYGGGGVAIGDVSGDGRPDLFFTANMGPNKLYLNRGNFRFEDVTREAGVAGPPGGWTTGVTMADVNGDGRLDLYVCRSGDLPAHQRRNLLYINQGDGTFTEEAAAYGLDDAGNTTHAAFFDYDRDGDLDLYVLNHGINRYERFDVGAGARRARNPQAGDRLYRNPGLSPGQAQRFVDVSEEAGLLDAAVSFGLSVTVSDLDQDGWPDLYVANDYDEDDYLYVNNGDGTFAERARDYLAHTSHFSMGADAADVNNDARPDLVTLDMLPEDNRRQKLLRGRHNDVKYRMMLRHGYHHQYMRNMLHLSGGDPARAGRFSEIGQLAGVSNTDWSWSALLADFDLDGYKDLHVTNGFLRDYTNMDFLNYAIPMAIQQAHARGDSVDAVALLEEMPQTPLANYVFRNRGAPAPEAEEPLVFEDATGRWGLDRLSTSNGAAYGDLDGDGDLDLVVSNINQEAFLYRNDARRADAEAQAVGRHFLKVELRGEGANRYGLGAKVTVRAPSASESGPAAPQPQRVLYQEQYPARGYQSSVDPVLVFGLGAAPSADVHVAWPDGAQEVRRGVEVNGTLTLRQEDATPAEASPEAFASAAPEAPERFAAVPPGALGLDFVHRENDYVDFRREPLLPHMLSRFGPALAVADLDSDARTDVFVGGARGQAAALYRQRANGAFARVPAPALEAHARYEDVAATFFDADGDGDRDLYIVSGGNDVPGERDIYQDRLYLNDGAGALTYAEDALPAITSSGGAVAAHDYDGDGDVDLFVGGRVLPDRYPYPPRSYVLENIGPGAGAGSLRFRDATPPALRRPGLVASAAWGDLDGDAVAELVFTGEWMPVRVFRYANGAFAERTAAAGLAHTNGWWNGLRLADLDADGDLDLAAGNQGTNTQMRPSRQQPVTVHAADFDGNGAVEAVISYAIEGRAYPMPMRDELLGQIGSLLPRYPDYASYADATVEDLFPEEQRADALVLQAYTFETSIFENDGNGTFRRRALPLRAQFAPVSSLLAEDLDGDGAADLLVAGNDFGTRAALGRQDAGRGLFLRGTGGGALEAVPPLESGFVAEHDVRHLVRLDTANGFVILVANNDAPLQAFALRRGEE